MNISKAVFKKYKSIIEGYMSSLSMICDTLPDVTIADLYCLTDEQLMDKVEQYIRYPVHVSSTHEKILAKQWCPTEIYDPDRVECRVTVTRTPQNRKIAIKPIEKSYDNGTYRIIYRDNIRL